MALWFKQERKYGLIGSFAKDFGKIARKEQKKFTRAVKKEGKAWGRAVRRRGW